ncbi:MAG: hypothetical protein HYR76_12400 [Ignavibacteria bacterium]|nr:hypothetical protein [Ignavibacteria bacterium]
MKSSFLRGVIGVLICCVFLAFVASSQEVRVTAKVDSNHILIGDWIKLHVEVEHLSNATVTLPSLPDSIEGFEIIQREAPTVKKSDRLVVESATFTLTAFDSGMHVIPPISVKYTLTGDTTKHTVESSPIPIMVRGVAVDTTKEIKDVKPPLSVPISFAEVLPYLIGILAVAGLVWLYYYIRRKKAMGESLLPEEPPRPAHEIALDALRSLRAEQLWQRGKVKEYYSQLTDVIRLYIEGRFDAMAMEMTSDEILASSPVSMLSRDIIEKLREILIRADLVKFAKFQPLPEEHESSMTLAFGFVESTWQKTSDSTVLEPVSEVKS